MSQKKLVGPNHFRAPSTPPPSRLPLQRRSTKSGINSPSRSDSASLSKFYIKNVPQNMDDPEKINKMFDKLEVFGRMSYDSHFAYDTALRKPTTPLPQRNYPKLDNNITPKTRKSMLQEESSQYKQLYQKQAKQFKESAREIATVKLKNKVLQQNHRKLSETNQKLLEKVKILEAEAANLNRSTSIRSTVETEEIQHTNPINRLKSHRFLANSQSDKAHEQALERNNNLERELANLKTVNMRLNKPCQGCSRKHQLQQQYRKKEQLLFQAEKSIKSLNIEIGCIQRKAYNELKAERKLKDTDHANLKKRFTEVLTEYTKLRKVTKKQEISHKVRTAWTGFQKKEDAPKRRQNLDSSSEKNSMSMSISSDQV